MPATLETFGNKNGFISGSLVANTPTEFAHGLFRKPSFVHATVIAAAAAAAVSIVWDEDSSDSTNITLVASANCDFRAYCLLGRLIED